MQVPTIPILSKIELTVLRHALLNHKKWLEEHGHKEEYDVSRILAATNLLGRLDQLSMNVPNVLMDVKAEVLEVVDLHPVTPNEPTTPTQDTTSDTSTAETKQEPGVQ